METPELLSGRRYRRRFAGTGVRIGSSATGAGGGAGSPWRRRLSIQLLARYVRLDEKTRTVGRDADAMPAMQPAVARRRFVVTLRIAERVCTPCQQGEPIPDGLHQHLGTGDARQIEIAREIVDELLHRDVVDRKSTRLNSS